ncbi:MAG TPA: shikimate kinase [Flavobacteriaceae bacterium]|jgi:shikimate kinase|nr:shikimate kinase [Flavobacteriaceae bacterium]
MKMVLVGYMGSGKSTIGRLIAHNLGVSFIDLDHLIEVESGLSVTDLFAQKGVIYFRKLEQSLLQQVLSQNTSYVLSTGGGTPAYGDNMSLILSASDHVVYLQMSVSALVDRLMVEKTTRPLIAHLPDQDLPEFIGKHLFERLPFYAKASIHVLVDHLSPQECVERIMSQTLLT